MKRYAVVLLALAAASTGAYAQHPGKGQFDEVCGACHGANGAGIPGLAPSLKGNQFVQSQDVKALAAFIQKGRSGSEKKYKEFPSPMPPYGGGQAKAEAIAAYVKGDLQK
jgi:mono/diheme cytochrome c family protein